MVSCLPIYTGKNKLLTWLILWKDRVAIFSYRKELLLGADIHGSRISGTLFFFLNWWDRCGDSHRTRLQYIPRNMHTVFALLCFVVVIHWLIFPYPSGLLHWHCGNLTIDPVPAKQPWWIWINTSCEFIMNDCIYCTPAHALRMPSQ